ncbi:MAG: hypothetical protein ACJ8C4_01855 [Gemmataceae bacterium]
MRLFSRKKLLIATVLLAVMSALAKWLLLTVAAQLILALGSAIALWLGAGALVGAGIGSAYDKPQKGAIFGAAIQLLVAAIILIWCVI